MKQHPGGLRRTKKDGYSQIGRRETAPRLWKRCGKVAQGDGGTAADTQWKGRRMQRG
ncbi:hypothetical protein [Sphingobacterium detergens]|uniref:hypothetical protein n=1 Tax=Sphingobacterium detergens TaxID=1145106 RepID=UPI00142E7397|nr:hypothetical protein [Sphingobacterium detergens]